MILQVVASLKMNGSDTSFTASSDASARLTQTRTRGYSSPSGNTQKAEIALRFSRYILAAALVLTTACSDAFQAIPWDDVPLEATLFSASRDSFVGKPSAFDLVASPPRTVAIESETAAGTWDVVLIDNGAALALESAVTFEGVRSSARIATIDNTSFDNIKSAPKDTVAYSAGPVNLALNKVYIIKSRTAPCAFTSGPIYAKIQPLEIDVPGGFVRFKYVDNPNCGDRSLDAPED